MAECQHAIPASRSRRFFCQALLEETGGEVLRWATIADVAKRLGMDEREAECAEADYVRLDVKARHTGCCRAPRF